MLVYKSAFDIYHCMFRIVALLDDCPKYEIGYDRARIFDYFFAFPHRAAVKIKHIRGSGFSKGQFKTTQNNYLSNQEDKQLFFKMSKVFEGATRCLAAYGEIDVDNLKKGILKLKSRNLAIAASKALPSLDPTRRRLLELFTGPFHSIHMAGDDGLKARTGLVEHRYDI